jgi:polyisoprenoid-binding protein YceI
MATTIDTGQTRTKTRADRWQLEHGQSNIEFRIEHLWGLTSVRGRFSDVAGTMTVANDDGRRISLEIEAASLDTGNPQRDRHLRSGDFFDTPNHPLIRFESTEVADENPGRLRVAGRLEAAGKTIELRFPVDFSETGDEIDVRATVKVDQRQLGMTWSPLGMVRGSASVTVDARLRRTAAEALS